jgi:cobyrinic acid a,c-diamide synthase
MSLIIAGERSGVGKTTVTLALLAYLRQQGLSVQSFKVGPDYIDPMFHRHVTGRPCRNLDPWLTSETYVQNCFSQHSQDVEYALIEGVMGLFDGAAGRGDFASTAHIARLLKVPVLLVLDCSRLSHSVAALVHGYRSFDSRLAIAGVVLNRVGSDRHLELLQLALEPLNIPILGVLRRQDSITIPDRHLGLVPTAELNHLNPLIDQLAHLAATCFDWSQLMPLVRSQESGVRSQELTGNKGDKGDSSSSSPASLSSLSSLLPPPSCLSLPSPRIAIAQDQAFSFYYADNLDILEALGAELVPWSPLEDERLPTGVQGLYLGGGFPEMFAAQLATNKSALQAVHTAIQAGIPTYAECGGLMYLCQQLLDFENQAFPMVGVLPTTAIMGKRLTLGYRQVEALQDGVMFERGAIAQGHEFHRSHLASEPDNPLSEIKNQTIGHTEGWHRPNLHASYIHIHWGATLGLPRRFLCCCAEFAELSG